MASTTVMLKAIANWKFVLMIGTWIQYLPVVNSTLILATHLKAPFIQTLLLLPLKIRPKFSFEVSQKPEPRSRADLLKFAFSKLVQFQT